VLGNPSAQQEALIEEIRGEAPALAAKDGFVSLTAWKPEGKDYRVLVEGRWASQAHFEAAVAGNAQALAALQDRVTSFRRSNRKHFSLSWRTPWEFDRRAFFTAVRRWGY
jgi:heme-degrading monooxygenase HmoA